MKPSAKPILLFLSFALILSTEMKAQETPSPWMLGVFGGAVNYQGDLQPSSFTFDHSNLAFALTLRKPLGRWLSFKTGFAIAKIEAADRFNRDYLITRNLSFFTSIKEFNAGLEINMLDISTKSISPYLYGGISVFHFNPWTYDENGSKVYLKPLGTEGQGLDEYPDRKPYKLLQPALAFGGGVRFSVNEMINVGIEFSQRKSFTDYLDDVSTTYVDFTTLYNARGAKATDLSYRGDELPGGRPYPHDGEQRGTPTEMDWYYFIGVTVEIKLSNLLRFTSGNSPMYTRCPQF